MTDFPVHARPTPPSLESIDIAELFDELFHMAVAAKRFAGIQLRKDYSAGIIWQCDRGQICQAPCGTCWLTVPKPWTKADV
ncbi:MAG: hypothetical protein R2864_10380 [Syntrophotaleaceae bacterium]